MNRILIVEDDSSLIRGLKDSFVSAGFDVLTAMDGVSGLKLAMESHIDVMLLDLMLPRKNGYEVCAELRKAEKDMTIIMLTAKGQEKDVIRGLNLGADDYVTKPFSVMELIARVNAFLRRKPIESAQSFGNFELDFSSRKLHYRGAEIALSPKEFGLLSLFLRRSGRALSRDMILDVVWGSGAMTTARSVDRCVTTLRNKLREYDSKSYIVSIRDIGYRFDLSDIKN